MSQENDMPAFPIPYLIGKVDKNSNDYEVHYGMTLRDYFAGQVLPSCALAKDPKDAAKWAYEYADAMLAERVK